MKNYRLGSKEVRRYDTQKREVGVHVPKYPYPLCKASFGESYAGYVGKADSGVIAGTRIEVSRRGMLNSSFVEHCRVLTQLRSMPKPRLP